MSHIQLYYFSIKEVVINIWKFQLIRSHLNNYVFRQIFDEGMNFVTKIIAYVNVTQTSQSCRSSNF